MQAPNLLKSLVHRPWLMASIIAGTATGCLAVVQSWWLATFLDSIGAHPNLSAIAAFALTLGLRALFGFTQSLAAARLGESAKSKLREVLMQTAKKKELDASLFASLWVRGVDSIDAWYAQYLPQRYLAAIVPFLILLAVAWHDKLSALVLLVAAPLVPIFMILIGKLAQAGTQKQWKVLVRLQSYYLETLQGLRTLKLLGLSRSRTLGIALSAHEFRMATMKVLRIAFLSSMVLELVATLGTAMIAVQAGIRLLYGELEFQEALFVLVLAPEFFAPLRALGQKYHAAMEGKEAAEQIAPLVEKNMIAHSLPCADSIAPDSMENQLLGPMENTLLNGSLVQLVNLYVRWPGRNTDALQNVTLQIQVGETILLTGDSGAGKSTLASLLLNMVQPTQGSVVWPNGRPTVAWVPQRPTLLHRNLRANLTWGEQPIADSELEEVIQKVGLEAWFKKLPHGLDTIVEEQGMRLSGGQRQRLAIARALLQNASFLLLDEPVSQLDETAAQSLLDLVQFQLQNKTVLIIAHGETILRRPWRRLHLHHGQLAQESK